MKIVILLFLPLISLDAAAEIYKWLDRNGNIVYSQSPPPADASSLKTPEITSSPDIDGTAGKAVEEIIKSEKEARKRRETRQQQKREDQTTQAQNKQLQRSCQKLRDNLNTMKSNNHIYTEELDGSNRFLSKKELSQKILDAEQQIQNHCTE